MCAGIASVSNSSSFLPDYISKFIELLQEARRYDQRLTLCDVS